MTISRRRFTHLLGAGAAFAAIRPAFSTSAQAGLSSAANSANGIVRLSSNENPYGPSARALKAMTDSFDIACRYPDEHADAFTATLGKMNGVNADQILLGDGSGEILRRDIHRSGHERSRQRFSPRQSRRGGSHL
jgi:histidinol-phosphate aminotransferase